VADYQLFINGEFVEAEGGETFATHDPATGEQIAEVAKASRDDAIRAIQAARKAFDDGPWPRMSGPERAKYLSTIAELIGSRQPQLAEMEARDGGGTIRKAQLADVGIDVRVETEELGFDFDDFELAWEVLAGVTTAQLPPERRQEAKEAVQAVMWPHGRGPRHFRNVTQFLVGRVAG